MENEQRKTPSYFKLDLSKYGKLDSTSEFFFSNFIRKTFDKEKHCNRGNRELTFRELNNKGKISCDTLNSKNLVSYHTQYSELYKPIKTIYNYIIPKDNIKNTDYHRELWESIFSEHINKILLILLNKIKEINITVNVNFDYLFKNFLHLIYKKTLHNYNINKEEIIIDKYGKEQ